MLLIFKWLLKVTIDLANLQRAQVFQAFWKPQVIYFPLHNFMLLCSREIQMKHNKGRRNKVTSCPPVTPPCFPLSLKTAVSYHFHLHVTSCGWKWTFVMLQHDHQHHLYRPDINKKQSLLEKTEIRMGFHWEPDVSAFNIFKIGFDWASSCDAAGDSGRNVVCDCHQLHVLVVSENDWRNYRTMRCRRNKCPAFFLFLWKKMEPGSVLLTCWRHEQPHMLHQQSESPDQ